MPQKEPKLRGKRPSRSTKYQLGEFPKELVYAIAKHLTYLVAVNTPDLSGSQWAACFADAVGGDNLASNLDPQDIALENCAWSAKTVKAPDPFKCAKVRLIAGRNDPLYSADISDPLKDPQKTGRAVLEIWNKRVDRAMSKFDDYRLLVLIRDMNAMRFSLFESEITRFVPKDYKWTANKRNNLEGRDSAGEHRFTWQPHGAQFTVIKQVPGSAVKFEIKRPPTVSVDAVLGDIAYKNSWVTIHD